METKQHNEWAAADFNKRTLKALQRKGIFLLGKTVTPDMAKDLPYACGSTGYTVDDNDTGKVWTLNMVLAAGTK